MVWVVTATVCPFSSFRHLVFFFYFILFRTVCWCNSQSGFGLRQGRGLGEACLRAGLGSVRSRATVSLRLATLPVLLLLLIIILILLSMVRTILLPFLSTNLKPET